MKAVLKQWLRRHLWWVVVVSVLIGAMSWSWITDVVDHARVLTDVIRIDLDDFVDAMVGLAALITASAAWRKAKANGYVEHKHHDQLEERVKLLEGGRSDDDVLP